MKKIFLKVLLLIFSVSITVLLTKLYYSKQNVLDDTFQKNVVVVQKNIQSEFFKTGQIRYKYIYEIKSLINGKLKKVYIKNFDKVNKDQLLVELENKELEKVLNVKQKELINAENDLNNFLKFEKKETELQNIIDEKNFQKQYEEVKENKDNIEELYERGLKSKRELENAEYKLEELTKLNQIAKIKYEKNILYIKEKENKLISTKTLKEEELNNIQTKIDYLKIYAPKQGKIINLSHKFPTKYNLSNEISINKGDKLLSIAELKGYLVEIYVFEKELSSIKLNDPVDIVFKNKKFIGKISSIELKPIPYGDYFRFLVYIELPNNKEDFIPGSNVRCHLKSSSIRSCLTIPIEFVTYIDGQYFTYIKKGSSIKKILISIGASNGIDVEIVEGLKNGDTVYLS